MTESEGEAIRSELAIKLADIIGCSPNDAEKLSRLIVRATLQTLAEANVKLEIQVEDPRADWVFELPKP